MAMITLGMLAHVDAGKTSLHERILFTTGVIPADGGVDRGTTQPTTLELEWVHGIPVQSAVVAFRLNQRTVQIIDSPGYAGFVAEVGRPFGVLDEVKVQTRRPLGAVRAAALTMHLLVNTDDQSGAGAETRRCPCPRIGH
jgi:ribosomal protection tetracycline resistance protein